LAVSLAGVIVCAVLLLAGWSLRAPLILGLFASLPFGSTAIATLGGSSPQVFTVFALSLLAGVALSRRFADDLAAVLLDVGAARIVCVLAVYAVASAVLLPRLFAGRTTAHVVIEGEVVEVPLGPGPGNITQTAYFVLGALVFLALCILLLKRDRWRTVAHGFLTFATVHAALGAIDIGSKLAGLGDLLAPLRSASYALLVDVVEGGFWRIVGAYSEASAFACYTLPCLAFSFVWWRETRSRWAMGLAVVLLLLLVFSTSSTAYAGLAISSAFFAASLGLTALRGRLRVADLHLFAILWVVLAAGLAAYLCQERLFDPFVSLIDTTLINKAASFSGQERAYWNARGVDGFLDTFGVGIGMGSSRTSSWPISLVSQLGIAGAVLMTLLLVELLRPIGSARTLPADGELIALGRSARAAAVAWLAGLSISGASADPGLVLFICLATVVCCRQRLAGSCEAKVTARFARSRMPSPGLRRGRLSG
jgi:hypothetical protein